MSMVLLVDADSDSSLRLQKAFEAAGYEVSVASTGSSALSSVKQRRPDSIISRAMFEDMYGSELCSMVRAEAATKEIMFILLVDRATQTALAATRTEADMILPDNSPPANIVTRVDTQLRLRGVSTGPPSRALGRGVAVKAPTAPQGAPAATLHGSLAVMDLTEVAQAVAIGRKTGRLALSLPAGEGAMLFESGRVVHAEFGKQKGEGAFNALVIATHRERGGNFSFIPVEAAEASHLPKTINKDLETLLLNVAVEIDEIGRDQGG
jgi:DNA-binding response OmpR family regulator